MGLVYLIQPAQCNGLSRYKIGHSTKDTMDRLKTYPAQSRIICVMGLISNPLEVERALIGAFHQHFQHATCGTEYFEGDVEDMMRCFDEVVKKNRVSESESSKVESRLVGIKKSKVVDIKKKHACTNCSYSTDCKSNFNRHVSRKISCDLISNKYTEIGDNLVRCNECLKNSTRYEFVYHLKKCKGVPANMCEFCNKLFKSSQSKCNHRKTCKFSQNPKHQQQGNKVIFTISTTPTSDHVQSQ